MTRALRSWGLSAVIFAAVVTRFTALGAKLFHHDEAIHAWFSLQLATGGGYHADPVYHGPLLYHLEAAVFRLAGQGDVQARSVTAAFGVILIALLYEFVGRQEGEDAALVAALMAIVSPTLVYYSRFDSHDMLVAAFTAAMIVMPFEYARTGRVRYLAACSAACALGISTKLNAWFSLVSVGACLAGYAAYAGLLRRPWTIGRRRLEHLLVAGVVFVLTIVLLFGTTLVYEAHRAGGSLVRAVLATANAIAPAGFSYWLQAHRLHRLGGPFYYYLVLLFIYEPLVFLSSVGALFFYMRRRLAFSGAAIVLVAGEALAGRLAPALFATALAAPIGHVMLASFTAFAGVWAVVSLWTSGRTTLACWMCVGVSSLLLYSYAGEKVPWLAVHIVLPWLVVSSVFLRDSWRGLSGAWTRGGLAVAAVALGVITLRAAWVLNTRNRSDVAEPLLQLEYTEDVRQVIRSAWAVAARSDEPVVVRMEPAVQWPFAWYLRSARPMYGGPLGAAETAPFLLAAADSAVPRLAARYTRSTRPFLHWTTWIDNVQRGDLEGMLRFMLLHRRWGQEQSSSFVVWTRKDVRAP
jgi:uncharacterized protein (TIGR03663 family)